ncbi:MAG: hypothetical protein GFH27_549331n8 [Chloroflexi bacterium AL-W]|nr:hypothetical protein [Chloroflexi bacterium AL-N1]NOK70309.1 hypothetical protein [Chloroflexi bacterium AL-N10]NOK77987.1 hypothetical protein [Chloroflexi bacterium AL-N5]NOK85086.1 hypothetical protein [Chloroflexi bacterium AL-W]
MHIRIFRTVFVTMVTLAAILATPWSGYAHAANQAKALNQDPDTQPALVSDVAAQEAHYDAIQRMEQHLEIAPDGTFRLNVKSGAEIGVDEATFTALYEGMEQTNALLRKGELQLNEVQTSTVATPATSVPSTTDEITPDACNGRTGVDWYWWGPRIFLNSCDVGSLEAAILAADTALVAAALIGIAQPLSSAIAIILFTKAVQIMDAARLQTGIWIDFNYVGGVTAIQPQ